VASPELQVLHIVVSRLEAASIPYMLSGSTALGAYATPRMTRDLDVVVQLEPADAARLTQAFAEDFYCDAAAVDRAVAARGMVNVIHLEHVIKVDFIIRRDTPYRQLEFTRRRQLRIDDQDMWVVAPEDLVLSKLDWAKQGGSAIQAADVRELIASVPDLDWAYLERWAGQLGVAAGLAEARA
jgi:hypothetical protein